MKKILIILIFIAMAAAVFAQTRPFEVTKNSYDPFIAEKGGFDSLFINPAGMAGQTEAFVYEMEAGTSGKTSTYKTLEIFLRNPDLLTGETTFSDPTPADLEAIMDLLVVTLSDADVVTLLNGTTLDTVENINTTAGLAAYLNDGGTISEADVILIGDNAELNPTIIKDAVTGLTQDLKVNVEATVKMGTLIHGFGIGVYGNAYSVLDAASMGFSSMIGESGVKAGYGFNLGPLGLGVSADFAMLGYIPSASIADLMTINMVYGYAWGIDFGATFDILPSLTVGAVMTDIIGSYADAGTTTLEELMLGTTPSTDIPYTYSFDMDLDVGVTWAPDLGKLLKPSFSVDYYDFIGMFRNPPATFQDAFNHMRFGAELELLTFLNVKAQYYQEFFTLGAGVDLLFLEVFGEFLFNQEFTDIGASVLVKLHF